jgi:hypothetical protein
LILRIPAENEISDSRVRNHTFEQQRYPKMHAAILSVLLLAGCLAALATPIKRTNSLTAADIIKIDSSTSSCANPPAAGECRSATQAAPYVALSYTNFNVTSFGEQAALLSLMLYESGSFKYSKNHYPAPGRPGQGTRNMQMPAYNLKYAQWLATTCTNCGITSAQVDAAEAKGPAAVLDLVNTDEWGFGSAAWFLVTQCEESVRQGLAVGTQSGWEAYLTGCVQTTATSDRTAIWSKAIALGRW